MKRTVLLMSIFTTMALAGASGAKEEREAPAPKMILSLVDGSCIIGTPGINSIPLQTSYAKMNVPLKEILCLKMNEDHETASVDMCNGDKIKGVVNLEPIRLETIFGKIAVGVEHITDMRLLFYGRPLPEAMKQGLVMYYSFNQNESKKVIDESNKGNHSTIHGAKWTNNGKSGGAYEFDNSGYMDAGADLSGQVKSAITMSAWVCPRITHGDEPVIAKEGPHGRQTFWFGVYNNRFGLLLGNGNGWSLDARACGEVTPGKWQHLAATWDGSTWRCYHNGKLVGEGSYSGALPDSPSPIQIGQNSEFKGTHFQGTIDEVMIYNRGLSEKEIQQIYELHK